jgi:hypothetical protein
MRAKKHFMLIMRAGQKNTHMLYAEQTETRKVWGRGRVRPPPHSMRIFEFLVMKIGNNIY